jgi:hypothetical protein
MRTGFARLSRRWPSDVGLVFLLVGEAAANEATDDCNTRENGENLLHMNLPKERVSHTLCVV